LLATSPRTTPFGVARFSPNCMQLGRGRQWVSRLDFQVNDLGVIDGWGRQRRRSGVLDLSVRGRPKILRIPNPNGPA
jgi:hypothetical protein